MFFTTARLGLGSSALEIDYFRRGRSPYFLPVILLRISWGSNKTSNPLRGSSIWNFGLLVLTWKEGNTQWFHHKVFLGYCAANSFKQYF